MLDTITCLAKGLLYDSKGTISFGRFFGAASFLLFALSVLVFLGLLVYVVLTGQMAEAAPLATAVAGPLSALFGSTVVAQVVTYWTTKRLPGGGISAEQLGEPTWAEPPCEDRGAA